MNKKLIRNMAAISIGTLVLCIILFVISSANTTNTVSGPTVNSLGSIAFFAAILSVLVSIVTGAISYFGALIKAAQLRKMGWFVGVLLFGVWAALLFGLIGPEVRTSDQSLPSFLADSYKQTKRTMGM